MPPVDIEAMKRIALLSHERAVEDVHGKDGIEALRALLEFVIQLYRTHDPESIMGSLFVVQRLPSVPESAIDRCVVGQAPIDERVLDRVRIDATPVTVTDLAPGVFRGWGATTFDSAEAAKVGVVYRYHGRRD